MVVAPIISLDIILNAVRYRVHLIRLGMEKGCGVRSVCYFEAFVLLLPSAEKKEVGLMYTSGIRFI